MATTVRNLRQRCARTQMLGIATRRPPRARPTCRGVLLAAKRDEGQAFVEFVIIVPIVLGLIFIVVGYAVALSNYDRVTDAARVGARAATIARFAGQNNPCAAATSAINATSGLTLVGAPTCSCQASCVPGNTIKVTITVVAQDVLNSIPFISAALPGSSCGSKKCWTSSATAVLQ